MSLVEVLSLMGEETLQTFLIGKLIFNTSLYVKLFNIIIVCSLAFLMCLGAIKFIFTRTTLKNEIKIESIKAMHQKMFEGHEKITIKSPLKKFVAKSDIAIRSIYIADSLRNMRIYKSIACRAIFIFICSLFCLLFLHIELFIASEAIRNGDLPDELEFIHIGLVQSKMPNFEYFILHYSNFLEQMFRNFIYEFKDDSSPLFNMLLDFENSIESLKKEIINKLKNMKDEFCNPLDISSRSIEDLKSQLKNMLQKLLINSRKSSEDFLQYYPDLFSFVFIQIDDICGKYDETDDGILQIWEGNPNERFTFTTEEYTRCTSIQFLLDDLKDKSNFESNDTDGDSALEKLDTHLNKSLLNELQLKCIKNKDFFAIDIETIFSYIDEYLAAVKTLRFDRLKLDKLLIRIVEIFSQDFENDNKIMKCFILFLMVSFIIDCLAFLLVYVEKATKFAACLINLLVSLISFVIIFPLAKQYYLSEMYEYALLFNGLQETPIRTNHLLEKSIKIALPSGTLSDYFNDTSLRDLLDTCSHEMPILNAITKAIDHDIFSNMDRNFQLNLEESSNISKQLKIELSQESKIFLKNFVEILNPIDILKVSVISEYFENIQDINNKLNLNDMKLFRERFLKLRPEKYATFARLVEASERFLIDINFINKFSKIAYALYDKSQDISQNTNESEIGKFVKDRLDKEMMQLNSKINLYMNNQFARCKFVIPPIETTIASLRQEYGLHAIIWDLILVFCVFMQLMNSLMLCHVSLGESIVEDAIKNDMIYHVKSLKRKKRSKKKSNLIHDANN